MDTSGPSLLPFADGVWLDTAQVRFLGLRLSATMAVLRLGGGDLLVYSPLPLTAVRRAAVEALGRVGHLYVPNLHHQGWIGEWAEAFSAARVHAPAAVKSKRRDLRVDRVHGDPPDPALSGFIEEIPVNGCRLGETALYYRSASTLIVADLVHNVGRPGHAWTAAYTRMMGFYDRVALSRALRWTAFSDRRAARRSIDELLAHPFDRLVVGHGEPIEGDARGALAATYSWLRS
jgi:hypothetical protein